MKKSRPPPRRKPTLTAPAEAARAPTYDDLLAIAKLIESGSRFSEFRLRSGDIEVEVRRGPAEIGPRTIAADAASGVTSAQIGSRAPGLKIAGAGSAADAAPGVTRAAVSPAPDKDARGQAPAGAQLHATDLPPGTEVIRSPMVGTFYRSPAPGEKPFVEEGSKVEPDTILCIIEVMKLMNSVTAGFKGVVTHIFVQDTQPVEFGQGLIGIRKE